MSWVTLTFDEPIFLDSGEVLEIPTSFDPHSDTVSVKVGRVVYQAKKTVDSFPEASPGTLCKTPLLRGF